MKRNSNISLYYIPRTRGHFLFLFSIVFFLLVQSHIGFSQTWSMQVDVTVGDTVMIGRVLFTEFLNKCTPNSVTFSHNSGTDFYLDIPMTGGIPSIPGGNFMFAPRKVGEQVDTFYVTVGYEFSRSNDCSGKSYSGPIAVSSRGIAKLSINPQIKNKLENFQIWSISGNQNVSISSNFSLPENPAIELYDALGRQLPLPISQLQIPSGPNTEKLDVGNIASGWYILRMKTKDQVISKSFIVTR